MKPGILVAPTEPAQLKKLGRVSLVAEKWGADIFVPALQLAIQRKQVNDLVASMVDGRLAKEMMQMRQLPHRFLIVEGRFAFNSDGEWINGFTRFTQDQYWGQLTTVQKLGVVVLHSNTIGETVKCVEEIVGWVGKTSHSSVESRPKTLVSKWGTKESEDWLAWLYQSFEGIGPRQAREIVKALGAALAWTVTEKELQKIPGIGKVRARSMMRALENGNHQPSEALAVLKNEAEFFLKMARTDAWRNHAQVMLDAVRALENGRADG